MGFVGFLKIGACPENASFEERKARYLLANVSGSCLASKVEYKLHEASLKICLPSSQKLY